jgi:hypothetical protein
MLCFGPFADSPQRNNHGTSKTYQGTDAKFDQYNCHYQGTDAKFDQYNRHSYQSIDTEERGTYHHPSVAKAQRSLNQLYSNISVSNSDSDKRAFGVPPDLQDSLSEQRVPIMNRDDFDQYQKRVRFTTGQDPRSEQSRSESESRRDVEDKDIPAHEYVRVDVMHAQRDDIRPYVRSEIENAGMKALLAEESGSLGGRPEGNNDYAQDDSILAGEWGRFTMSDVRNEGVKAVLAGEFERLKLACMCVPSPLRKRRERYSEDNVMVSAHAHHMCVCVYVCVYIYLCVYVCIYIYIYIYIYACVCVCALVCLCMCALAYINTYIHT